jgi:hypothetical protein
MDDEGIKAAIEYGKAHTVEEIANDPEWTKKEADETEATLMSIFNMIALKSAQAKTQGKEFSFDEAKAMFKSTPEPGTLGLLDTSLFYVMVYGSTEEFCQDFSAELRQGDTKILPIDKEIEPPTKSKAGLYYTHYRLFFPIIKINIKAPVALVLTNPLGKEWKYEFDLGKIR